MEVAVAKRPVETFDTAVTLPEWQLEPDEEAYFGEPDNGVAPEGGFVDEDGNPVRFEPGFDGPPPPATAPDGQDVVAPEQMDQQWIDRMLGRPGGRQQQQPEQQPEERRIAPPRRDQEPAPTP
jgi:penicillin-binding protein 1A